MDKFFKQSYKWKEDVLKNGQIKRQFWAELFSQLLHNPDKNELGYRQLIY